MILRTQNSAGLGALDAVDAVGWRWSHDVKHSRMRRSWLRVVLAAGLAVVAIIALALCLGFLAFIYSLERKESSPAARADGIVALTGGSQRIGDAIDLLAQGYASRLLFRGSTSARAGKRSNGSTPVSAGCSTAVSISTTAPATPSAMRSRPGGGPSETASAR